VCVTEYGRPVSLSSGGLDENMVTTSLSQSADVNTQVDAISCSA
jgi:hypothetical protein